jgi:tetratricopeptide (TPR) repeat protein
MTGKQSFHTDGQRFRIASAFHHVAEKLATNQHTYRLRAWMLLAGCLVCASVLSEAQKSAPPVESSLMEQLHQAISIAERGDEKQALSLTNSLLAEHPDFVSALKFQGELLEDAGHESDAAHSYEKAIALAPNDPELLLKVGIYSLVTGNNDQAISLLNHHLRLVPHDRDALYYLAQAYHLKGENDLALKAIEECARVDPTNASVLQKYGELLCSSGDTATGLKWLLKAQQSDPDLARIDFDLGVASYDNMDLPGALKYTRRASDIQPNDPAVLALLASIEVKLAQWQDAKTTFQHILTMNKDDAASLLGLGQSEVELKDYQDAIDTLGNLLHVDPTQISAHYYLSRAYAGLGNAAEAQHQAELHHLMMQQMSFVRTLESDQRENAITSQARELLAQHREDEARRLYQQHFKGTPATLADSYVFVGKLYLFMGDTADGLRNLHHALAIEPTVRGTHTYEGILALKVGDLSKAESEFKAELANDPNYQMAIAEMGEVRYRQQRWSDAAQLLAKSRTMTPELLYMLCDSYFHTGQVSDADLNAETLAVYGRNNPELMQGLIELLKHNGQLDLAQRLSDNLAP